MCKNYGAIKCVQSIKFLKNLLCQKWDFLPWGATSQKDTRGLLIYGKMNHTSYPENLTICKNVSASKQAIIHIQVYDMGWATEENVTITAYGETIAHIAPNKCPTKR